jgi:uncharacterized C2H2 Zn-finger protein
MSLQEEYINNNLVAENVDATAENVDAMAENVDAYKCPSCYKSFQWKKNYNKHIIICNGKEHPYQCLECKKSFSSRSSLAHHRKTCKGCPIIPAPNQESIASTSVPTIQNANQNNNNQVTVLPFPTSIEDLNYDFITDKITNTIMKNIMNKTTNKFIRLNNFIGKVFENPQNRVIKKSNPKQSHSMIHTGDGNWEFAHDSIVFPLLTHHLTTAALQKLDKVKKDKEITKQLMYSLDDFIKYIEDINQENFNQQEYNAVLQRIKIMIVNLTQQWLQQEEKAQCITANSI